MLHNLDQPIIVMSAIVVILRDLSQFLVMVPKPV